MEKLNAINIAKSHLDYYNYLIDNGLNKDIALKLTEKFQDQLMIMYFAYAGLKLPTNSI